MVGDRGGLVHGVLCLSVEDGWYLLMFLHLMCSRGWSGGIWGTQRFPLAAGWVSKDQEKRKGKGMEGR